ncbi:MAG: DUF2802 domain-containing protein [Steroidobacteraceae bacterium]
MSTPDLNIAAAISIGAAALAVLALLTALITWGSMRRWRARCASLDSDCTALRRDLELVASVGARTERRLQRIEQEYSGLAERLQSVELSGAAGSIDQAIAWARRGADPNRLTQQFGLSRSEAELVARLHGREKQA